MLKTAEAGPNFLLKATAASLRHQHPAVVGLDCEYPTRAVDEYLWWFHPDHRAESGRYHRQSPQPPDPAPQT